MDWTKFSQSIGVLASPHLYPEHAHPGVLNQARVFYDTFITTYRAQVHDFFAYLETVTDQNTKFYILQSIGTMLEQNIQAHHVQKDFA